MTAMPEYTFVTVREYFELDDSTTDARYEYIDGRLRMLAGGTLPHSKISANIISTLNNALRSGPCRVYTSDARVRLSETRYVYPNVSVSCDERDRKEREALHHPCLVVEVLSPGTEIYDRLHKALYYRACPSIKEYLLVYSDYAQVELFRREKEGLWSSYIFKLKDSIPLTSLSIHISMEDVYAQVDVQVEDV